MKPTPRATVIEFFFPQGFAHDYEFTVGVHCNLPCLFALICFCYFTSLAHWV